MASVPPTANLLAFEAVARRRSFALAAAELHLTASAISHQVARLESQLGVRLLERSAHGVRLSAAGEQYLSRVGGALSAITAATDDLRQGMSNSLYVHSAPSIASLWLMPRLRDFAEAHPDIALNLSVAHTHSDFALGYEDGEVRLHVPITTNPGARFRHNGAELSMRPGECWYVNVNRPHAVANDGEADRVHLVVDCLVNDWLTGQLLAD